MLFAQAGTFAIERTAAAYSQIYALSGKFISGYPHVDIVDTVDNFVYDFFVQPAECFEIQEKAEKPKIMPKTYVNKDVHKKIHMPAHKKCA